MNFNIHTGKLPDTMTLTLKQYPDGSVLLCACDPMGNILPSGSLLMIRNNGDISRVFGVDPNLGFQINDNKQIRILGVKE